MEHTKFYNFLHRSKLKIESRFGGGKEVIQF